MESGIQNIGKPAPYGRACVNCARAKCKCILRNSGGCERCHRLKRECTPSSTVRQKRSRPSPWQTARLEQKLDGLVSLLKAGNRSLDSYETVGSSLNSPPIASTTNAIDGNNGETLINTNGPAQQEIRRLDPLTPVSVSSASRYTLSPEIEPSPEEAERYFQIYRTKHLAFLPIIYFGEDMTAKRLRQESPFLWLSIMAISSTNAAQQNAIGRVVREMAARDAMIEGDRSIDLLLGLLTALGWAHYQSAKCPLIGVFSHICTAITLDLDLQKPCHKDGNISYKFYRFMAPQFYNKIRVLEPRSLAHRRTALACFFLTSSAAGFHARVEHLAWSPYLEECTKVLEDAKQTPGDELLVYFVKLQRIASKVTTIRVQMRDVESEESTRLIEPYVASLRGQLADLKAQTPPHITMNKAAQIMTLQTEITITELILLRIQHAPLSAQSNIQTTSCLLTCLSAIKSWFDTAVTFESDDYAALPLFFWKDISTIVITLIRLASLDDPAWDVDNVRQSIDLPSVLGHIQRNTEKAGGMPGSEGNAEDNMLARSLKLVTVLKSWVQSVSNESRQTTEGEEGSIIPPDTRVNDGIQEVYPQAQYSDMDLFSCLDQDLWMGDALNWWPTM